MGPQLLLGIWPHDWLSRILIITDYPGFLYDNQTKHSINSKTLCKSELPASLSNASPWFPVLCLEQAWCFFSPFSPSLSSLPYSLSATSSRKLSVMALVLTFWVRYHLSVFFLMGRCVPLAAAGSCPLPSYAVLWDSKSLSSDLVVTSSRDTRLVHWHITKFWINKNKGDWISEHTSEWSVYTCRTQELYCEYFRTISRVLNIISTSMHGSFGLGFLVCLLVFWMAAYFSTREPFSLQLYGQIRPQTGVLCSSTKDNKCYTRDIHCLRESRGLNLLWQLLLSSQSELETFPWDIYWKTRFGLV